MFVVGFFSLKGRKEDILYLQEWPHQEGCENFFHSLANQATFLLSPFALIQESRGFNIKNNWAVSVFHPDSVSVLITRGLMFSCKAK